mmetsp:Transcript_21578/g.65306  ORF Transcript_21578/g.65306 Transcript_21578/m.65306 type:complete len:304 (+) Transcript_21578:62-973(+)
MCQGHVFKALSRRLHVNRWEPQACCSVVVPGTRRGVPSPSSIIRPVNHGLACHYDCSPSASQRTVVCASRHRPSCCCPKWCRGHCPASRQQAPERPRSRGLPSSAVPRPQHGCNPPPEEHASRPEGWPVHPMRFVRGPPWLLRRPPLWPGRARQATASGPLPLLAPLLGGTIPARSPRLAGRRHGPRRRTLQESSLLLTTLGGPVTSRSSNPTAAAALLPKHGCTQAQPSQASTPVESRRTIVACQPLQPPRQRPLHPSPSLRRNAAGIHVGQRRSLPGCCRCFEQRCPWWLARRPRGSQVRP